MKYRNDTTFEVVPGHSIGTDEDGDTLWQVPSGWTPLEPVWFDPDGFAHELKLDFSIEALENIEETGADVADDLARLRAGTLTEAELLAHCLDGAGEDRAEGWQDYVRTLVLEAEGE